jgi:hypothetical protein
MTDKDLNELTGIILMTLKDEIEERREIDKRIDDLIAALAIEHGLCQPRKMTKKSRAADAAAPAS